MSEVSTVSTAWAVFSVVGGSIIGATISATVSFWMSKRTAKAAKAQREADRYEVRKTLAYSLLFKMIRMHSTIAAINFDLGRFVEKKLQSDTMSLWQVVLPFSNLPDKVKFTPEEMTMLLSLDDKLFNELGAYDEVHNSLLVLCDAYRSMRTTVMAKFGASMEGNLGTTVLTPEQAAWFAPRAAEMEDLVSSIVDYADREAVVSRKLLESSQALFAKEFKIGLTLEFKDLGKNPA